MNTEATDSQLSVLIKKEKIVPDSQEVDGNTTRELGDNTLDEIINGQFSPLMSQNSENELEKHLRSTPGIEGVFESLLHNEIQEPDITHLSLMSTHPSESGRQPELIKTRTRTPRIVNDGPLQQTSRSELLDLNALFDTEESALMNQSIESETTLTQFLGGSQPIDYLRERTKEEQDKRNQMRQEEKLIKKMQKAQVEKARSEMFSERNHEFEPMECDNDEEDVFRAVKEDSSNREKEEEWLTFEVKKERASKVSDFEFETVVNDGIYLWAKMKCNIPFIVKWNVSSCHKQLFLKVRLVNYMASDNIENSIRVPSNLAKCHNHRMTEEKTPRESFFYVVKSGEHWTPQINSKKDQCFVAKLAPGTTQVLFDLIFKCQRSCLDLAERRKRMCLAVFLEDENGNELLHDVIKQLLIVGYPRRDWKNFCEKRGDFKFSEKSLLVQTTNNNFADQSSLHSGPSSPEKVTDTSQMFQSTSSSSRKRAASDVKFVASAVPSSDQQSYPMRLHGCESRLMEMSFYRKFKENEDSSSNKRPRSQYGLQRQVKLSEKEYSKFVAFFAKEGENEISKYASAHCLTPAQASRLDPSDKIEKFLAFVGDESAADNFRKHGLFTMLDLDKYFQVYDSAFETIGVDSSKMEKYYDLFLHYHRVQENIRYNQPK
ncbi:hypothetical protein L5515_000677 [Caenorhabditis briggsae]|uniref:Transcription factor cep-1 n=2 Tax=Caenorhabditis briggsae TaxID=6238 RepID=A0AAE9E2V9_CAEBR|nr:hypothetical protein L5515_000675 [Caenorhabditis briggsae]UMM11346.1 hypothetical protein L5515_000677 [Caenorhabditis briggsae]